MRQGDEDEDDDEEEEEEEEEEGGGGGRWRRVDRVECARENCGEKEEKVCGNWS